MGGMKLFRSSLLCLAAVLAAPLFAADLPTYPCGKAKDHVGETATVTGPVPDSGVHVTQSGTTFINLGPAYPDNDFTAVIFAADADKFGDLTALEGKKVSITGVIKEYKGKPEIEVTKPEQIKTLSD
jgi:hypothetical protein